MSFHRIMFPRRFVAISMENNCEKVPAAAPFSLLGESKDIHWAITELLQYVKFFQEIEIEKIQKRLCDKSENLKENLFMFSEKYKENFFLSEVEIVRKMTMREYGGKNSMKISGMKTSIDRNLLSFSTSSAIVSHRDWISLQWYSDCKSHGSTVLIWK